MQISTFAVDFGVWLESREGGERFFKKAAGFLASVLGAYQAGERAFR